MRFHSLVSREIDFVVLGVGGLYGFRHGCCAEVFCCFFETVTDFTGAFTAATCAGRSGSSSQARTLFPSSSRMVPSDCSHTVTFRFTRTSRDAIHPAEPFHQCAPSAHATSDEPGGDDEKPTDLHRSATDAAPRRLAARDRPSPDIRMPASDRSRRTSRDTASRREPSSPDPHHGSKSVPANDARHPGRPRFNTAHTNASPAGH